MDKVMQNRVVMAVVGALAGISLYALAELLQQDILPERVAFALAIFAGVFFTAVLALAGPLRLVQAAAGALGVAVLVTALLSWAGLRFDSVDGLLNSPMHVMAAFAVAALPLPFIIARHGAGVRDYPTLFTAAWGIIVRGGTAFVFTGLVWGVIWLSDTLLNIVGLKVINSLLNIDIVPWLITGAVLGLALAVVEELRDYVSPHLILRLVRLLVPVVLVVIVVFCVALPIQGFAGAFDSLSAAGTLITMAGAGAALVSTAIDRDDADATQSPLLAWSTRALAVVLPVPAGLGAYAVWLRVGQYGWTPERLFAGLAALMALAYALFYCVAVLRRGAWMARVRQVNIGMAAGLFALSMLWLTPVLNAERIAAHSQLARFTAGTLVGADVVPYDYRGWGIAGAELLATLKEKSTEPGQEALAASLQADQGIAPRAEVTVEAMRTALMAELPLQPMTATAARDRILAAMDVYDAGALLDACRLKMPDGQVGCAMTFADLLPATPGDEAVVGTYYADNYGNFEVMFVKDGLLNRRSAGIIPGTASFQDDAAAMIAAMHGTIPAVQPAPVNMMTVAGFGLMPMP